MSGNEPASRELNQRERDLLFWLLPVEGAGYRPYAALLHEWRVVAEGRRGEGSLTLGPAGSIPDGDGPLPPTFAFGVVMEERSETTVTIRERVEEQVDVEIQRTVRNAMTGGPSRWTYSRWSPGDRCPCCGNVPRVVSMHSNSGNYVALVVCREQHRLWIFSAEMGINQPLPPTHLYNELMFVRKIRDPRLVMHPRLLFEKLEEYSDAELVKAFVRSNTIRPRAAARGPIVAPEERPAPFGRRMLALFRKPKP